MFKELCNIRKLRDARRIVRLAREDGYDGPFVVLREPMMQELQQVYGRTFAENLKYIETIDHLLEGKPVCDLCEDCAECENPEKETTGKCQDFMLSFVDHDEAAEAFNKCYRQCANKCGGPCSE